MSSSQGAPVEVAHLAYRFANLQSDAGYELGVEVGEKILNVTAAARRLGLPAPRDMDDLLQNQRGRDIPPIIAAASTQADPAELLDPASVRFAPLVTRPEKILCVGFNYRQHADEVQIPLPATPPLFSKFANALNHHGGTVDLPTHLETRFDFETELVVVFGAACKDVAAADALDYVAGYAVGNDLSARTLQMASSQYLAGKAADGFAPLGPWLATRARIPDPNRLRLQTRVNGQKRQDGNTSDMAVDCRALIAYVSSLMTMKPGDVLFTGTPQGVILGEKAPPEQRRWLRPGDAVVSEIDGLGQLAVQLRGPPGPVPAVPRTTAAGTVDGLMVLSGGEAHVTDISQWSPGVNAGQPRRFSNNVYLIRHGADLMVWDTGVDDDMIHTPGGRVVVHGVRGVVTKTLRSQFAELGIRPEQVSHIAFSHGHFDHVGNSRYFTHAKWHVQEDEFAAMFGPTHADYGFIPELYATMRDNAVVLTGDEYDVFGDGSVVILGTPGHTPGHQSLLVRLKDYGPVVLSGDVAHFWDNFCCRRVPHMNPSKEKSRASMDKIDARVKEEGAELWINHDWDQSQKIPRAPTWIT